MRLRLLFRSLFRRRRVDAELDEELQYHLEREIQSGIARGLVHDEAEYEARRAMGAVTQNKERCRDARRLNMFDEVIRGLRHSLRAMRRNPAFTAAALLTLAMGMAANTAVYSVVNAVLLKPLRYPDAGQLVSVQHTAPGAPGISGASGDLRLSASMFFTYLDHNRAFSRIGAWIAGTATVTGVSDPEEVRTIAVTQGLFEALDVPPATGRWLNEQDQEPGAPATVVLSYGYWQRKFGGDPSAIGRELILGSVPREIVGAMPRGFKVVNAEAEVFLPFQFDRSQLILPGFAFQSVARLKPGITIDAANRDIARLIPVWMDSWPAPTGVNSHNWEKWRITPAVRPLKQAVVGRIQSSLWVVMGTIGPVLLIACSNVANLLLVRADARQRELAIRAALGAGRGRIFAELLLESTLLGVVGGVLGTGIAFGIVKLLLAYGPPGLPRMDEIAIDARVLGFGGLISVLAGLLLGVIPAMRYAGRRAARGISSEGRSLSHSKERHRTQSLLVIAQVGLAFILLIGAGLMLRTFAALQHVDPGYSHPEEVETMRINVPPRLIQDPERVARTYQEIAAKIAAIPGVKAVGFATTLPSDGLAPDWDSVVVEGRPPIPGQMLPLRRWKNVSPGFFEAMGTRLVAGRSYDWSDLLNRRPMVMISENLARELWGDPQKSIGKRIGTFLGSPREIIGVVQDVYDNGVQDAAPSTVYWPAYGDTPYVPTTQQVSRNLTLTIRSPRAGDFGFLKQIEQAVWSVNSNLSLAAVQSMGEIHSRSMARTSFTAVMLAIAGGMALVLGAVGLYGVLAYAVTQRRREVGIRIALGAQPGLVKVMFLRYGLSLTCTGVAAGLIGAAGLSRVMSSLLFAVRPFDPITYLMTMVVLVVVACAATYLPARRAAHVDPIETLRSE